MRKLLAVLWLMIPIGLVIQVILIFVFDVSTVRGVLMMNIYSMVPGFFLNLLRTRQGIHEFKARSSA